MANDTHSFHELSYSAQKDHWIRDAATPERLKVHQGWFREDTVDFWRHERMSEAVFHCLLKARSERWLTVGDGRYGLDAIRMLRRGFGDVTASDLTDHLLQVSLQAGALQKISAENAERLSFADKAFDYVLCKEAFHHFPRPMLALYEMLRVACKGVVLIEPQDAYVDLPTVSGPHAAMYETDGNYVYTLSRREVEKVALGLNLPAVAFKSLYDVFDPALTDELAREDNPRFVAFRDQVQAIEAHCESMQSKHNVLLAVVFVTPPDAHEIALFTERGWSVELLQRNPYLTQVDA